MRARICNPKNILLLGKYSASCSHLKYVISQDKFHHGLTNSDINGADKMNFLAALKITSDRVLKIVREQPDADGTEMLLQMTRDVLESFLSPEPTPEERIYLLWRSVFFLRLWRQWLLAEKIGLKDHFITYATYICIELNAHALIKLSRQLRDAGNPELFLPHLFASQACESFFRWARAMTTTQATVVNFDILDLLRRLRKIELQGHITHTLGDRGLSFPR
ncbi:hypothetical protein ONE63_008054 [Megalurothrips usitatus]|uniref:Uncharacterized protein n=1 Tax=Megalurothrips usitatus TaxID=439358 RepID=A0AAV7XQP7_9NEOP|nr:hypothetical protein ONE63_008054 [Megalurothrips usitatus]